MKVLPLPDPWRTRACFAIVTHHAAVGPVRRLLPNRGPYHPDHPLGCHRPRVADRAIFDKLVQVLVFGCGYRKIADATCSATTSATAATVDSPGHLRRPGAAGLGRLRPHGRPGAGRAGRGRLHDQGPCGGDAAGRGPVDRGKQGRKRSIVTEARGIPLGAVAAGANRHDALCWAPPWPRWTGSGGCPPCRRCTWTAAMTATRPARCWPSAA
jgi:hypothetical protein